MNWQKSIQFKRLKLIESFDDGAFLIFRYIFIIFGLSAMAIIISQVFYDFPASLVALSYFLLSPLIIFSAIGFYVDYLKRNPSYGLKNIAKNRNILDSYDYDSLKLLHLLSISKNWSNFWFKADKDSEIAEVVLRLNLSPSTFSELEHEQLSSEVVEKIAKNMVAKAEGNLVNKYIFLEEMLGNPTVKEFLKAEKIEDKDVENLIGYYHGLHLALDTPKTKVRERTGGIGKTWAISYTNLLDAVTTIISLNEAQMISKMQPIYSREKIVNSLATQMLKQAGQNVLLVGEPGVGKTEIFYHFAAKILSYQTETELDGRDIRELDIQRLLSSAQNQDELKIVIDNLFNELSRAGNVILFINQIELLLEPSEKIGTVDLGSILQGYLNNKNVIIVGTIDAEKYLKLIKSSALLKDQFAAIDVPEPDRQELIGILLSQVNHFENRYGVFFLLDSIKLIISLSERYIKDQASPQKELNLIEEIASSNHASNKQLVEETDVTSVIEQKVKVPLQVSEAEGKNLANLEEQLHQRIIGQNHAIKEVSDALIRARAGLTTGNKPIGSFLFLGPTGVGKTETAKALAATYFGGEDKLIRLDMSEYADQNSLVKLLGTDSNNDPGSLTIAIQKSPSAVILLDEVEKSNEQIKNAFLQLLDEGHITTNYGKVLDFTNTIIIATSNAGSDYIKAQIERGVGISDFEKPLIDGLISQKIFLTEFLNRFDGVIVFAPLTQAEIEQVVGLQVKILEDQLKKDKGLSLELAPSVVSQLASKGYDPVFGARALQRVIKDTLETKIAKQIIAENPQPGSTISVESL